VQKPGSNHLFVSLNCPNDRLLNTPSRLMQSHRQGALTKADTQLPLYQVGNPRQCPTLCGIAKRQCSFFQPAEHHPPVSTADPRRSARMRLAAKDINMTSRSGQPSHPPGHSRPTNSKVTCDLCLGEHPLAQQFRRFQPSLFFLHLRKMSGSPGSHASSSTPLLLYLLRSL
jgi:hypothetical protein